MNVQRGDVVLLDYPYSSGGRPVSLAVRRQGCRLDGSTMKGYDTNLAAEFHVLSVLHRLGMSATLTLGSKKSVDIVVARDAGDAVTIDVKGLAGTTNWPVDNLQEGQKKHFIAFVTFLGKINDPSVLPEVYIVPSEEVSSLIYENPAGNRRVIQLGRVRKSWEKFKDAWELLR